MAHRPVGGAAVCRRRARARVAAPNSAGTGRGQNAGESTKISTTSSYFFFRTSFDSCFHSLSRRPKPHQLRRGALRRRHGGRRQERCCQGNGCCARGCGAQAASCVRRSGLPELQAGAQVHQRHHPSAARAQHITTALHVFVTPLRQRRPQLTRPLPRAHGRAEAPRRAHRACAACRRVGALRQAGRGPGGGQRSGCADADGRARAAHAHAGLESHRPAGGASRACAVPPRAGRLGRCPAPLAEHCAAPQSRRATRCAGMQHA